MWKWVLMAASLAFMCETCIAASNKNIAYVANGDARQTLDLHMPPAKRPPLLIFVHGGFWSEGDERYNIGNGIVRALVP
ncbi:MAG TPA: hypothetical protein VJM53_11800, partial [Burkholderiales bacterium]|nr:hypothetical protein [Burkholderiales bacterium]